MRKYYDNVFSHIDQISQPICYSLIEEIKEVKQVKEVNYDGIIECYNESKYMMILTFDCIFILIFIFIQIIVILFLFICL